MMTRKQIKEEAARDAKFVEWSNEDYRFIGRCPEIMAGGVHGRDEARVSAIQLTDLGPELPGNRGRRSRPTGCSWRGSPTGRKPPGFANSRRGRHGRYPSQALVD